MKFLFKLILFAAFLTSSGCMSWDEGWKTKVQSSGQGDVNQLMAAAAALEATADSGDKIKNVIAAYEKVIAVEPANFDALSKLGEIVFLYGYIYAKDKNEKGEYYLKSLEYCERALYTNPDFKKLADQGKPLWESVDSLNSREMLPMFYWYVGVGNYWNDCLNPLTRAINFYWPSRDKLILDRMTVVQPDWDRGKVPMSWGAYYSIVPGFLGGDLKKSAENFDKALQLGPEDPVHFYLRARYLHTKSGNKDAFKKDLETVLSKDLKKINFPYAWGIAYKMKAKELLGEIDKLF